MKAFIYPMAAALMLLLVRVFIILSRSACSGMQYLTKEKKNKMKKHVSKRLLRSLLCVSALFIFINGSMVVAADMIADIEQVSTSLSSLVPFGSIYLTHPIIISGWR